MATTTTLTTTMAMGIIPMDIMDSVTTIASLGKVMNLASIMGLVANTMVEADTLEEAAWAAMLAVALVGMPEGGNAVRPTDYKYSRKSSCHVPE